MADLSLPSQELLLQLLRYEAETGKLFWLPRALDSFARESRGKVWNARFAGKEACALGVRGYLVISLKGRRYYAHRIIWRMVTGEIPAEVDHLNGGRADNRFINLRAATRVTNGKNLAVKSTNTSGVNGVYWHKKDRRWIAYGRRDRKMVVIGRFTDKQAAADARHSWNTANGFHENHGQR